MRAHFFWLISSSRPRDCLAPPYTVSEDLNGAKPPVKTCYRCKEDGHVRLAPWGFFPAFLFYLRSLFAVVADR